MLQIDQRYFRYFDWMSFGLICILSSIGLLFVYSATYTPEIPHSLFLKKQAFGVLSGFIIYFIFCICDYRTLCRWGYLLYIAVILLLVATIIKGSIGMGAKRWIDLKLFKFQPSELAKLFFPAFFTYFFMEKNGVTYRLKDFIPVLGILCLSALLILKQPDLGTALLVLFSGLILMWLAGIPRIFFIASFIIVLVTAPLTWQLLKPYQKKRIAVFLGEGELHKERYQIEQSKIAIGSGGIHGKGFLQGTQNKFMFLPESRTDFIFSVICEEWGLRGAFIVLLLFVMLFFRLLFVITTIENFFMQLLATGLVIPIILSTFINIGMVTGLLPIVGIPLPFMSYGISHLWITFASLGFFNGIAIRRFYK